MLKEDCNEHLEQVLSINENYLAYIAKILFIRLKVKRFLLLNDDRKRIVTIEEILNHLKHNEKKIAAKPKPDIFSYGKLILKLQASGNIGNSIAYSCAINKLKGRVNNERLGFEGIT